MKDIDLIKSKLNDLQCTDSFVFSAVKNIESQLDLLKKLQETLYSSELYLVYKHTAPNGKIYIGITKNLPNARWNEGAGYETQKKFYKAIQAFGWINFKHEIIAAGLSEEDARSLESKLILEYRSNEDEYGYNTQALHNIIDIPTKKTQNNKKSINNTEIANNLIEKFSIKTVSGGIYYLKDDKYVPEKEFPIIKKELLLAHGIESRKHKEIIEQIKILSYAKKEEVFETEKHTISAFNKGSVEVDISSFFVKLSFDETNGYFISDDELYDDYTGWGEERNIKIVSKAEFVRKSATWMKKYRKDIERIITSERKGWIMRSVVLEEISGKIITQKGMSLISQWINDTEESLICVPMICEKALGVSSKGSRKLGNEICFALRNLIPGWEEIGVVRTNEYGNQKCFKRKKEY